MKNVIINDVEYELVDEYKNGFVNDDVQNLLTDYFFEYDYVLGDYSYNKLRLKGFYDSNNKKVKEYNDISKYKEYLENYCSTQCSYFLIKKKINVEKKTEL